MSAASEGQDDEDDADSGGNGGRSRGDDWDEKESCGSGLVMATMSLRHVMMFGDDDDGVATVVSEMVMRTAGLAETDVHPEMMPVTIDMTVSEIAEVRVMAMESGITMVTAKMTAMMVASP